METTKSGLWKADNGNWCITIDGKTKEFKNFLEALKELIKQLKDMIAGASFHILNPELKQQFGSCTKEAIKDMAELAVVQSQDNAEQINSLAKIIKDMCDEIKNADSPMLQGDILNKYQEDMNHTSEQLQCKTCEEIDKIVEDLKRQGYGKDDPIDFIFEANVTSYDKKGEPDGGIAELIIECDDGAYQRRFPIFLNNENFKCFRKHLERPVQTVTYDTLKTAIRSNVADLIDTTIKGEIATILNEEKSKQDSKEGLEGPTGEKVDYDEDYDEGLSDKNTDGSDRDY